MGHKTVQSDIGTRQHQGFCISYEMQITGLSKIMMVKYSLSEYYVQSTELDFPPKFLEAAKQNTTVAPQCLTELCITGLTMGVHFLGFINLAPHWAASMLN